MSTANDDPPVQPQQPRRRAIVLDTAALIAGTDSLYALGGIIDPETNTHLASPSTTHPRNDGSNDDDVLFYTTPDVIAEVRDARARARLSLLDGKLQLRAPSAEAVAAVSQFAKATGDYSVLSLTDLRVVALCWMLEVERGGVDALRKVPVTPGGGVGGGDVGPIRIGKLVPIEEVERLERLQEEERKQQLLKDDGWVTVEKPKRQPLASVKKSERNGKAKGSEHGTKQDDVQNSSENSSSHASSANVDAKESSFPNPKLDQAGCETVTQTDKISDDIVADVVDKKTEKKPSGRRRRPRKRGGKVKKEEADNIPAQMDQLTISGDDNTTLDVVAGRDVPPANTDYTASSIRDTSVQFQDNVVAPEGADPEGADHVEVHVVFEGDGSDNSDDGIGWINPSNLDDHLARDGCAEASTAADEERVACVTTDFAMQNTMLQMGLKILTVDGRRTIRNIKHFALRCHACGVVTRDLDRQFCDKCGNAAMHRVAFRVNKNGVAHAYLNPKKGPYLRGTKYSIPTPRGGRRNNDLILREDQIDPVKQRRMEKRLEKMNVDVLDPSTFYNAGARFNPHEKPIVVGYGRRNPNVVRPSLRRKR